MANDCTHVLTVTGPDPIIEQLVKSVCGLGMHNHLSFERIIPMPESILRGGLSTEDEADHPGRNWLAWKKRRWGSWSSAYDQKLPVRSTGKVVYQFTTAWTHTEHVMEELAAMFPELTFDVAMIVEFDESAMVANYHGLTSTWRPVEIGSEEFLALHRLVYGCEFQGADA